MRERFVASVSWGKDSLCMLLGLIARHAPLDEVVFYDTGMEFQAIYSTRDKILPILKANGIKYKQLYPKNAFEFDMCRRTKKKRTGEIVQGDSWCGGPCRWGTILKQQALNSYIGKNITYIGLAEDETDRLEKMESHKCSPLAEWKMTEADCLAYCYQQGYEWREHGAATPDGTIRLYDILDRVSCWCCANKNLNELRNIYHILPEYWERLKELQRQTCRPMKGEGKSVFDLETRFKLEDERAAAGLSTRNKEFFRELAERLKTGRG